MAETKSEVRSMHWAVKLLLTVVVGGLFPIVALFFFPSRLCRRSCLKPLFCCVRAAILVFPTTLVATLLYLRESNGWRRSLLMGLVVGLVASTIIMMVAFLLGVFLEWLVSMTQFV